MSRYQDKDETDLERDHRIGAGKRVAGVLREEAKRLVAESADASGVKTDACLSVAGACVRLARRFEQGNLGE